MSEIYKFDGDYASDENLHKKLNDGYHVHKITIYFDKLIPNLPKNDLFYIQVSIGNYCCFLYEDSYEYIDNKLSLTVSSINVCRELYENTDIRIKTINDLDLNIISFTIEIKKNDIIIKSYYLDNNDYNNRKYLIKSNYFKSFDELITFVMDDSNLSYELSKKYLTTRSGTSCYYKYVIDENNFHYHLVHDNYYTQYDEDDDDIILDEGESNEKYQEYDEDDY